MEQETKQQAPSSPQCEHCNGHCHSHHGGVMGKLFKGLLAAVVLFLVFMVGVAAGRKAGKISGVRWGDKMVRLGFSGQDGVKVADKMVFVKPGSVPITPAVPGKMMADITRMAGVVSSIDDNKIIITDNGGTKQEIYSTSSTIITSSKSEIPLSSLKAKQFIVSFITVKDGKNMAESIQVME